MDLFQIVFREFSGAGFKSMEELSVFESKGEPLAHPSRMSEYNHINSLDLTFIFQVMQELGAAFNADINLSLQSRVSLPAISIDVKVHNGALFTAVYFAKSKNIENLCQECGYAYSAKKNIWFKKIELMVESIAELQLAANAILGDLLIGLREFCTVIVFKPSLEKFYIVKGA